MEESESAPAESEEANVIKEIASNTNVVEESEAESEAESEELPTLEGEIEEEAEETEVVSDYAGIEVRTLNRSNIRMAADGLSEIYAIAPAGCVFKILGIEGDWVKIEYDGLIGYTYKTNVDGLPEVEPELDENGDPVPVEKKVTIFSSKWTRTYVGEPLALTSKLEGFDDCEDLFYQWMVNKGNGFTEIEGANSDSYYFTSNEENVNWGWKLLVYFK